MNRLSEINGQVYAFLKMHISLKNCKWHTHTHTQWEVKQIKVKKIWQQGTIHVKSLMEWNKQLGVTWALCGCIETSHDLWKQVFMSVLGCDFNNLKQFK